MEIKYERLKENFEEHEIEWRAQSCGIAKNDKPWALVLAYVQARAIQDRLDEVFGVFGWTTEYKFYDSSEAKNKNVICILSVLDQNGAWIKKEDGAQCTDIESFKGGISSAFKRVAASGYGIGRYLYRLETTFAEKCQLNRPLNKEGWFEGQTKDRVKIYWQPPKLPEWALPGKK